MKMSQFTYVQPFQGEEEEGGKKGEGSVLYSTLGGREEKEKGGTGT